MLTDMTSLSLGSYLTFTSSLSDMIQSSVSDLTSVFSVSQSSADYATTTAPNPTISPGFVSISPSMLSLPQSDTAFASTLWSRTLLTSPLQNSFSQTFLMATSSQNNPSPAETLSESVSSVSFASTNDFTFTLPSHTLLPQTLSSSSSILPVPTGPLCVGESIGTNGGSTIGDDNYHIVQQNYTFQYEIECYASLLGSGSSFVPIPDTAGFEQCLQYCDNMNTDYSPGHCQAVTYDISTQICNLISQPAIFPSFGASSRSARLIYSSYPFISDAFYLQPTLVSDSLGLCTNLAYAYDAISPQYGQSFDNLYENECGRQFGGSAPLSSTQVQAYVNSLPGTVSNPVSSTEDCMKLCDYANHNRASTNSPSCVMYTFDTTQMTCQLYGNTDGIISSNPTINAGRLINAAVGYPTPTDRPSVTGFEPKYQWVSMTVAAGSSTATQGQSQAISQSMTVATGSNMATQEQSQVVSHGMTAAGSFSVGGPTARST